MSPTESKAATAAKAQAHAAGSGEAGRFVWCSGVALVLAIVSAYSNSLTGEFLFDDRPDIVENPSIRHLWPPWHAVLVTFQGQTALHNRPVVNLSFALNYAVGGLHPAGYHLLNLVVHLAASLTLFGIVRRTLLLPRCEYFRSWATGLALAAAAIWALHPLQTQAVSYVVQRYESLMGMFYLLTLYSVIRSASSSRPRWWTGVAVASCLLALGSKEVAVSLPLVVLFYDRAFLAGSLAESWRQRRGLYLGMAACWAAFAVGYQFTAPKEWAGARLPFHWADYAVSQPGVILHYLRLCFWPRGQCADYALTIATSVQQVALPVLALAAMLGVTAWALVRRPSWGFLGAWFFLILAPTSSVLPLADLAFEHRMYLPSAAVVVAGVLGTFRFASRLWTERQQGACATRAPSGGAKQSLPACPVGAIGRPTRRPVIAWSAIAAVITVVLGVCTYQRNRVYANSLDFWTDVVRKAPENPRACETLGGLLLATGDMAGAAECFRRLAHLEPRHAVAHANLGLALVRLGRFQEAAAAYSQAVRISADPRSYNGLGVALGRLGRAQEAIAAYREAIRLRPDFVEAHMNLAGMLRETDPNAAIQHYRRALQVRPDLVEAHNLLGVMLKRSDPAVAREHFERALTIDPNFAEAHNNYANLLASLGQYSAAIAHYRRALEIKPDFELARHNLTAIEALRGKSEPGTPGKEVSGE